MMLRMKEMLRVLTLVVTILALGSCIQVPTTITIPTSTTMPPLQPTFTQLPSLTATAASETPTISPERLYRNFVSLLQKVNCKLPCLMGINPMVSTTEEAYKLLLPFQPLTKHGILSNDTDGRIDIDYPLDASTSAAIDVNYYVSSIKKGMIDHIILSTKVIVSYGAAEDTKIYANNDYQELLHKYSLPVILSTYGRPTQVFVSVLPSTGAEPGVMSFFDLQLAYPDKGFYLNYFTFATEPNNQYEGCPSYSFVSIWAEAPAPGLSNEELLTKLANWFPTFSLGMKPLEQVTNITIDQFFQTFSQPEFNCIDMPKSAWPTH